MSVYTKVTNYIELEDNYDYKLPFDLVGDFQNGKYFQGEFTDIINKIIYNPNSVYQNLIYEFYKDLNERINTFMDAGPLSRKIEELLRNKPYLKND